MQSFRTINSIIVTTFTHDVTSASKLRYSYLDVYKKTQKSRANVFCLPVDPLLIRHTFAVTQRLTLH